MPVALGAQHAGWILAAFLMINTGCFVVGYFWGKRAGAKEWCTVISRDAFADQIYNSLCASAVGDDEEDDAQESADNAEGADAVAQNNEEEAPDQGIEMKTQYYAQLAGFASLRSAEAFVTRLNKKHIHALIKERASKSAKGRSVRWYQVVTEPYEDQGALNSVVAILKKEEKLHDVRIVQG
jgi:cell division protein FtsN